jgi:hypothetical protein
MATNRSFIFVLAKKIGPTFTQPSSHFFQHGIKRDFFSDSSARNLAWVTKLSEFSLIGRFFSLGKFLKIKK